VVCVGGQPQPHLPDGRGFRTGAEGDLPVQPEVDVHAGVRAEVEEEVLAVRLGGVQHLSVDERGAVGEPALRAGGVDRRSLEAVAQVRGEPVQRVPLGHAVVLFQSCCGWWAGTGGSLWVRS
jgi:hypothetical protein